MSSNSCEEKEHTQKNNHESEGVAEMALVCSAGLAAQQPLDVPHFLSLLLSSGFKDTASALQRELAGVQASSSAVSLVSYVQEEKTEDTHP